MAGEYGEPWRLDNGQKFWDLNRAIVCVNALDGIEKPEEWVEEARRALRAWKIWEEHGYVVADDFGLALGDDPAGFTISRINRECILQAARELGLEVKNG